jgi:hypothetical protein
MIKWDTIAYKQVTARLEILHPVCGLGIGIVMQVKTGFSFLLAYGG